MKLERNAADGVHRIEDAHVNWYLVEEGRSLTIVDTGHPSSWKSLQRALETLGRSPSDVEAVVLTHGHFDHVGFARRAQDELGVPLLAPAGELELVRRPWSYEHERSRIATSLQHPSFLGVFLRMGAAGALFVKGAEATAFAGDGPLDVPGRLQPVPCPGHTHDHHALLLADRGALIAGDAIVTFNPYTGDQGPRIVSGAATADSTRALASLDALAATGAQTVLTGHGPVWRDGAAAAAERAHAAGAS